MNTPEERRMKGTEIMKYAISDMHGCYDKYMSMLKKINLSPEDELYVLGDVCDRGEDGIKILLDMMKRPNVIPMKGNHDFMAQKLLPLLETKYESLSQNKTVELFRLWMMDGGKPTVDAFLKLDAAMQANVLAYIKTFQYYEMAEAGGRKFLLAHTLPDYIEGQSIFDSPILEFAVGEPDYEKEYLPGVITVTGHTPTALIDPESKGKIWHGKYNVVIDCGTAFGSPLGCLCLDTMEEFYAE